MKTTIMNIIDKILRMGSRQDENDDKVIGMKVINAREDRDARRWRLNPTFDDLMADWERSDNQADYYHRDMGYGMLRFSNRCVGGR